MTGQIALQPRTGADRLRDRIGLRSATGRSLAVSTGAARLTAVSRAVDYMFEHLSEPIQLSDFARAGSLSPFHFHRVFRDVTSTTPARFLTSLRMAEAQRLLVTTQKTVTDICTAIGYSSLGTFISQFSKLTGLSPRRFRTLLEQIGHVRIEELVEVCSEVVAASGTVGAVTEPRGEPPCALLGLYRVNRPRELPSAFHVVETNRVVQVQPALDGEYEPIAAGVNPDVTVREVLATPADTLGKVGFGPKPLSVRGGNGGHPFQVALRGRRRFDPPVEFTRPLLNLARPRCGRVHVTTSTTG